jgi:type II secretory pathway pseudopilin PulG
MNRSNPAAKINNRPSVRRPWYPGITLLELTVVIAVMMSLITLLFFASRVWKRGADRAICIMSIQNVQKGLRSYSNLQGAEPGANIPGLKGLIIGLGRFVQTAPSCPAGGSYTYGEDMIPPMGTLYMECSLSASDHHEPPDFNDW